MNFLEGRSNNVAVTIAGKYIVAVVEVDEIMLDHSNRFVEELSATLPRNITVYL